MEMYSYDPEEATRTLTGADPVLGRLIVHHGPCSLLRSELEDPFYALLRSITFQQLSIKAASTIFGRLCALFPEAVPAPAALLALPDEALRGAGLSRAKTASVKDLAARTLDGTVPTAERLATLPDEEILDRLTAVRGVGPWTVEMLLIFNLGRPDVLPVTDLGVRKGFQRAYEREALPAPADLRAFGERWRPFRSVASWYLWRVVDAPDDADEWG